MPCRSRPGPGQPFARGVGLGQLKLLLQLVAVSTWLVSVNVTPRAHISRVRRSADDRAARGPGPGRRGRRTSADPGPVDRVVAAGDPHGSGSIAVRSVSNRSVGADFVVCATRWFSTLPPAGELIVEFLWRGESCGRA